MSASESPPLYEFYFRYKWAPADFAGFQDALVGCVRDAFGAVFGPALIDGGTVAPSGSTRAVTVQPYIAINDDGYLNVQNDITLVSIAANSSGNPRKDLIVARPKLVNGTMISRPTSPFDSVPLTILQETELVAIAGTPAGSPVYPSKQAGDVIVAGLAVANGATSFSSGNIDTTVTELISGNSNFSNWIVGKDTHGTAAITADSSATRAALALVGGNGHEALTAQGPANTPAATFTVASGNADAAVATGQGTGDGFQGTGGNTSGSAGVRGIGGTNGTGVRGEGTGTGMALRLIKGASANDAARVDGWLNMDDAANPTVSQSIGANRLTPGNMVKAWGIIELNSTNSPDLIEGVNIDAGPTISSNIFLNVGLVDGMASDDFMVFAYALNQSYVHSYGSTGVGFTDQFAIVVNNVTDPDFFGNQCNGGALTLNGAPLDGLRIHFFVLGKQ